MAQTTLFNTNAGHLNTTAYMIAGNSTLERMIGVAPEFPNRIFGRNELVTTTDVMNLLNVKEGDTIEAHVKTFFSFFSTTFSNFSQKTSSSLSA
jgi:hypothetical protein